MRDQSVTVRRGHAKLTDVKAKMSITPHGALRTLLVEVAQHVTGGLWVGGRATLTSTRLEFRPSALDQRMVSGALEVNLALREISSVRLEHGVLLDVVVVATPASVLRFRCVRAAVFADQIRTALTPGGNR